MKKLYFIVLGIVIVLIILRFGVVPNLSKQVATPECASITLSDLLQNAQLIIVGGAISERVQTLNFFNRGTIFTYTTISNIEVIKGELADTTLEAKQSHGCDPITGYCVYSSLASPFAIGEKYLLFLRPALQYKPSQVEPPPAAVPPGTPVETPRPEEPVEEIEEGVYNFGACGGKYLLNDSASIAELMEIIMSKDEVRWQEFLKTLWRSTPTDSGGKPGSQAPQSVYPPTGGSPSR